MVRQDIFEGLKAALMRGESLQQAMQSFYNAGYKKADIEKAARALYGYQQATQQSAQSTQATKPTPQQHLQPIRQRVSAKPLPTTPTPQPQPQQMQPRQIQRPQPQQPAPRVVQRVSGYGPQFQQMQPEKPKRNIVLITILSIILLLLIGALVGVIIFRENIIEFFAKVFGV